MGSQQQPERRHRAGSADLPGEFAVRFLSASQRDDPAAMRRELEQATEACGLGACLDDVLLPGMRAIGALWQKGQCGIEKERLATECARAWLQSHEVLVPTPDPGAPVLLACGPTDRHSLGLEALGILLRYQGQDCRLLGARVSTRTLLTAIRAGRPAAVVIVSHLRVNRRRAAESLRSAQAGAPELFYAGEAFATARLRRNLPEPIWERACRPPRRSSCDPRSGRTRPSPGGVSGLPDLGTPPEHADGR